MKERRGSSGRWLEWWRRAVNHFRWDDGARTAELDGARVSGTSALPRAAASHVSLDQLLERAADRRTQRGGAPG